MLYYIYILIFSHKISHESGLSSAVAQELRTVDGDFVRFGTGRKTDVVETRNTLQINSLLMDPEI
jgi:hypothetical protein